MNDLIKICVLVVSITLITACGGGGDDTPDITDINNSNNWGSLNWDNGHWQ